MFDLDAATRQARSLEQIEHRPWPAPARSWTIGQTFDDLLLAHWRVPFDDLRAHVPAELEIEEHSGSAWLGIVAFGVSSLRLRGLLPVLGLSSFRELNVRTYVRAPDGKPGVWFLSLDVSSRLVVEAGRRLGKLPTFHARIAADLAGTSIDYECARLGERGRVFSARYRPEGPVFRAKAGSLEWFLAERYCLYATDADGALHRAEIHHPPWPLQRAEVEVELTSIAPLELSGSPLCHFSRSQDIVIWPLEAVL